MCVKHGSRSLFGDVVQPDSLSLFSSTSSNPFLLWVLHQDSDLPEDSGIRLLVDASDEVAPSDPGITPEAFSLRSEQISKGACSEPVLHIQSPAIRRTFIRSPPNDEDVLDIKLPYISFQYRTIGSSRPFFFDIGIRDEQSRRADIRISSFQDDPKLHYRRRQVNDGQAEGVAQYRVEPLLHLPLAMAATPQEDETSLTAWQVLTLPLHEVAKHLSDMSLLGDDHKNLSKAEGFGAFHSISFVKVHANMRLRRVWCSRDLPDHDLPEFQVFS